MIASDEAPPLLDFTSEWFDLGKFVVCRYVFTDGAVFYAVWAPWRCFATMLVHFARW